MPHGVGMEGSFWRFTDVATGRVVIALTGDCRDWCLNAVAAHPEGRTDWEVADAPAVTPYAPPAGVTVEPVVEWPRGKAFGGLGPGQVVPGMHQYWHPHLLLGRARGSVGGVPVDGALAYAEKNWGDVFAGHWWWGQAHTDDATVCFAGGRTFGGAPTSIVLALDGRVHRWVPPLARTRVATARNRWLLHGQGPVHAIEIEAEAAEEDVHVLPVPVPAGRRAVLRSRQHLAGHLTVTLRRRGRVVYRGASALAGLERGEPSALR